VRYTQVPREPLPEDKTQKDKGIKNILVGEDFFGERERESADRRLKE
jgi:hypothetical protein